MSNLTSQVPQQFEKLKMSPDRLKHGIRLMDMGVAMADLTKPTCRQIGMSSCM